MARIIYAWELGSDYGHIGSFMPLALALREQGHEVIFVIRDLSNAETVVSKYGFQILQAPIWTAVVRGLPNPPLNYTEILLRSGFISKTALSALNRAWLGLFLLIKPSFLIADHSPVALFTARAINLSRAVFGTGFCSPPHISPLPNMRYWAKVPQKRLERSDQHVLEVANSLLGDMQSKAGPLVDVADLFKVNVDLLCTFSEMDHYPQRKNARYWGPVFNTEQGKVLYWQENQKSPTPVKRIFAYLKPEYKGFEAVLKALSSLSGQLEGEGKPDLDILIFSPDISPELANRYQASAMRFASDPIQLSNILPACDLAICHAGHGTIGACLLAGVPLLLLPMQLEQFLASLRIKQLGAAEVISLEEKEPVDHKRLISSMLSNEHYKQKAKSFAKCYSQFDQASQIKGMVKRISEVINQQPSVP